MESTKVIFNEDGTSGEVQLSLDNMKVGKMDISLDNGRLRVYHTEVDAEQRGKGFAKLLLNQLVSYAQENNLRIIPMCPFVFAQFKSHPEEYANGWLKKSE